MAGYAHLAGVDACVVATPLAVRVQNLSCKTRAMGKQLALSEDEADILRFCAQTFSASRRFPEHARCILEVLEKVPTDPARSELTWWFHSPPRCSPWWEDGPVVGSEAWLTLMYPDVPIQ